MRRRIGGWHRLWIAIALLHFIGVAAFAWVTRPQLGTVPHNAALYEHLSVDAKKRMLNTKIADPSKELDFIEHEKSTTDLLQVGLPDGHWCFSTRGFLTLIGSAQRSNISTL